MEEEEKKKKDVNIYDFKRGRGGCVCGWVCGWVFVYM